ncbi:MAG: cell division protein FtsZ [Salinibacter sp.]
MLSRFYRNHVRPLLGPGPTSDARIAVVGVGGGGGNAINNMVERGMKGVDFIAVNTDTQDLSSNKADYHIQIGAEATGGLGAGARPEVGATAVEESREEIAHAIEPYDMVFITAGMGGGTGTGGAPGVAAIARDLDLLTLGIVTRPFTCEGPRRMKAAEEGIQRLRVHADTLLVIPNDRLLDLANEDTSLREGFWMADEVLYDATRGVVDLIIHEGLINLDFADVERTMKDGGMALLGMSTRFRLHQNQAPNVRRRGPDGASSGAQNGDPNNSSQSEEAAIEAVSSPLFDGQSIHGADEALVNVTGGPSLGFREAMSAIEVIQSEAGENCDVIFGAVIDEEMDSHFRVTVIATGLGEGEASHPPSWGSAATELGGREPHQTPVNEGDGTPSFFLENGDE